MATADQIPSDMTLEIGADVSPDRFLSATRAFFGYVEEVGRTVVSGNPPIAWVVKVREGSALIGVEPQTSAAPEVVRAVYERVRRGVSSLARGDLEGADLPEDALKHLRVLSDLSNGRSGHPSPMRLWIEREATTVSPEIGEAIREDQRSDYRDVGTIEGRLDAIQEHSGLELRIRDQALRQTVRCSVPESMLAKAFENFRKRVEVSGLIHFRRNGTPISIEASDITALPDDADLPSLDEVRGLLASA